MIQERYNATAIKPDVMHKVLRELCMLADETISGLFATALHVGSFTTDIHGHHFQFYYVPSAYGGPGFSWQEVKPDARG